MYKISCVYIYIIKKYSFSLLTLKALLTLLTLIFLRVISVPLRQIPTPLVSDALDINYLL